MLYPFGLKQEYKLTGSKEEFLTNFKSHFIEESGFKVRFYPMGFKLRNTPACGLNGTVITKNLFFSVSGKFKEKDSLYLILKLNMKYSRLYTFLIMFLTMFLEVMRGDILLGIILCFFGVIISTSFTVTAFEQEKEFLKRFEKTMFEEAIHGRE